MHILIRAGAFTVLALLVDALIAVVVPGGGQNSAAGLLMLAGLTVPAAIWGRRDGANPTRAWSIRSTWAAVAVLVAVLTTVVGLVRGGGQMVSVFVGVLFMTVLGIYLPAAIGGFLGERSR